MPSFYGANTKYFSPSGLFASAALRQLRKENRRGHPAYSSTWGLPDAWGRSRMGGRAGQVVGTRSTSRSFGGKRRRKMGYRSRRTKFGKRSGMFRKRRFGGGRSNGMLKRTLQYVLARPHTSIVNSAFNINRIGNSQQNQSQWYFFCGCTALMLDQALQDTTNQATTGAYAGTSVYFKSYSSIVMRNNHNQDAEITMWKWFPRIDFPVTGANVDTLTGTNPAIWTVSLPDSVENENKETQALAATDFDVTPYHNSQLTRMGKISLIKHVKLVPGGECSVGTRTPKQFKVSKFGLGVDEGVEISSVWQYLRRFGPIVIVRFRGTIWHDESTVTSGTSTNPTITVGNSSEFSIDIRRRTVWSYKTPLSIDDRAVGRWSTLGATATQTNEGQYQPVAPAEQAPST